MFEKYLLFTAAVLAVLYLAYKSRELERVFKTEVSNALKAVSGNKSEIITEEDIRHLPEPVRKYLEYTGAVGRERIRNFRIVLEGEFKTGPGKDWSRMTAVQYNEVEDVKRFYFMGMKMFGIPIIGLHKYKDAKATMLIKLAGLITVAYGKGEEMNQGETVTVFNDMCMFAPASLIDERIQWEPVDSMTAKGIFNNRGIKVSALLFFNEKGELVNFVSDDRYYSLTGKTYEKIRWSTPAKEYKEYNGIRITSGGEALWSFPEGDYCYIRMDVKEIEYNI